MQSGKVKSLHQLCQPVVEAMGYELVGIEYRPGQANALVRVYIDQPEGISLDDCAQVSHQLSGLFDVEDPISGHYTLEVSSPGLDRPLFEASDFARFIGHKARIQMQVATNGQRKFTGVIQSVTATDLVLAVEQDELNLSLDNIDKARLVPEL